MKQIDIILSMLGCTRWPGQVSLIDIYVSTAAVTGISTKKLHQLKFFLCTVSHIYYLPWYDYVHSLRGI
jgi:hypothetical protein